MKTTSTGARRFETGDVVFGRAIFEGVLQPRRKGVVLGSWTDTDTKRVVVWWYGLGPATGENCTVQWNHELKPAGDIWDMSARTARRLADRAFGYWRANQVRGHLARHAGRMKQAGAQMPVSAGSMHTPAGTCLYPLGDICPVHL